MNRLTKFLPFMALAAGVLAISWSAIFIRWTRMPGVASGFYRMLIASVVLGAMLLTRKTPPVALSRRMLLLATLGGVFFATDIGCYNEAVLQTGAGSATFLGNNAPLMVGLFTWLITRSLPSRSFWLALLLGSVGAWLILYADHVHAPLRIRGDLLATFASVCFALYLLVTERAREQMETLTLVSLSTLASTVVLLLFAFGTRTSLGIPSGSSLLSLLGLGLVCQLAGYLCLTYALGHLPATTSSVVLLAVSPLTAVWAFLCFGERMTPLQWFGGCLILAAVWLAGKISGKGGSRLASTEMVPREEESTKRKSVRPLP